MTVQIQIAQWTDRHDWDRFVFSHPQANLYHRYGWRTVIENAYHHTTCYLMARSEQTKQPGAVAGILPLVHLKHFIFGNHLVSMPFFDMGGVLATDNQVACALLERAHALGKKWGADTIELRHTTALEKKPEAVMATRTHKVRMLLQLPKSSEALMQSFRSKLRSQVRRPMKAGLAVRIGGDELLDDFYTVFCINMRDLGSPVHSRKLMEQVLAVFPEQARIVVVYQGGVPLATGLVLGFKDVLENPWASSLRKYSRLSPNMLLYWSMLAYACDNGYGWFDFGRSTPEEGTYRFKRQWGSEPHPLHWQYLGVNGMGKQETDDPSRFDRMIRYWQKLPVPVTKVLGPMIRKHIGL